MPLPHLTISTLQAAGSAVFTADTELKKAVQEYAESVKLAMLNNPFDLSNDNLFEDWKTVARLSQSMTLIESELRKIYSTALGLVEGTKLIAAMPKVLSAPTSPVNQGGELQVLTDIQATDISAKTPRKPNKKKPKPKLQHIAGGNAANVLAHLQKVLNKDEFAKINQSAIATEIGLPKGSIGASIARLIKNGSILEENAAFKLPLPNKPGTTVTE